ncbi:MAG: BrnA antitoxin family protein [Gemmatimonadaceae bacterium]
MAKRSKFSNTAKHGQADLARLRRMTDAEIERTAPAELPFLPDDFWKDARVVVPPTKEAISFRVDADVLKWFRTTGPRYQSRMNAVLRSYVEQMAQPTRRRSARKTV